MGPRRFARRLRTRWQFGDLRRVQPLGEWGFERGRPVDRFYIEGFLERHADLIRGHALEVDNDRYASRFGATSVDIVDVVPENPDANIIGDLCDPGVLRPATYDVQLITQVLQLVSQPVAAIRNLTAALKPGGSLLLTVPTMSRLAARSDRWRWTPAGMQDVLRQASPPGAVTEVVGYGNSLVARAYLFALSVEDLEEEVLRNQDEDFPLVVCGRVTVAS